MHNSRYIMVLTALLLGLVSLAGACDCSADNDKLGVASPNALCQLAENLDSNGNIINNIPAADALLVNHPTGLLIPDIGTVNAILGNNQPNLEAGALALDALIVITPTNNLSTDLATVKGLLGGSTTSLQGDAQAIDNTIAGTHSTNNITNDLNTVDYLLAPQTEILQNLPTTYGAQAATGVLYNDAKTLINGTAGETTIGDGTATSIAEALGKTDAFIGGLGSTGNINNDLTTLKGAVNGGQSNILQDIEAEDARIAITPTNIHDDITKVENVLGLGAIPSLEGAADSLDALIVFFPTNINADLAYVKGRLGVHHQPFKEM